MPPYTRVNWQDGQAGGTAMSAANLNRMDKGIADVDAEAYRKPTNGIPGDDIAPGGIGGSHFTEDVLTVFMFAGLLMQAATQDNELVGLPRGFLFQDVQDDLGKAATAVQPNQLNALILNEGGNWSSSTVGTVGLVVTYNHGRYYCREAHAATGTFPAAKYVWLGLAAVYAATDPGGGRLWVKAP